MKPQWPAAGRHQRHGERTLAAPEASTSPCRVRWMSRELLAAKQREQLVIDRYATVGRDLTDRELASLLLALRTVREITKHMARLRGVLMRKGGRRHA